MAASFDGEGCTSRAPVYAFFGRGDVPEPVVEGSVEVEGYVALAEGGHVRAVIALEGVAICEGLGEGGGEG